jgi:hypothetical protein
VMRGQSQIPQLVRELQFSKPMSALNLSDMDNYFEY